MIFRRLAKDSALYGSADLVTKLLAFIAFPILAKSLTPNAFGTLELITTVTALLGVAINCGLNNSVQRFYWDKDTNKSLQSAIVSSGFIAQVFLGVAACILGLFTIPFLVPFIHSTSASITWLGLVAALILMTLSQWSQYILDVLRLHFAPWLFFTLALLSRVGTISIGLFSVVVLRKGLDGLLISQAFLLLIMLPLALWFIRKDFNLKSVNRTSLKALLKYGYPFIYSGLAYWLFGSIDRWMLATMSSVEEVGIYSVAYKFASIVLFVSVAFGQAWSPVAIKIGRDYPSKYRIIYGDVLLILLYLMLVIGGFIALFSGEVLGIILPLEYHESALPLSILCFGIAIQSTQQVTAIGISLEKQTHLFARISWIAAFTNLAANFFLIPRYGAAGAAWGTLISYTVLTTSFLYYTQNLHPMLINWNKLIPLLLLGAIVAFASSTLVSYDIKMHMLVLKLFLISLLLLYGVIILPVFSTRKCLR
jgi:O-antigen/teichoic acid export membrane protein